METDKNTTTQNSNKPRLFPNKFNLIIGFVISGLLILAVVFYGKFTTCKNSIRIPAKNSLLTPKQVINPDQQPTIQPLNQTPIITFSEQQLLYFKDQPILVSSSLSNRFVLSLYPPDYGVDVDNVDETALKNKCLFKITDKTGNEYDLYKILGTHYITCSSGDMSFYSSFLGWVEGEKFLIDEKAGEIKIVNIEKPEVEIYKYNTDKYIFINANRSLKYWLFKKTDQKDGVSFSLFDRNTKVVLTLSLNPYFVLYDEINDGFLFINKIGYTTYPNSQDVGGGEYGFIEIDFLSMNNLTLHNILTTEPEGPVGGRGCYLPSLKSKLGEIILTPDCLTVGNKYLGIDGNIHIKL